MDHVELVMLQSLQRHCSMTMDVCFKITWMSVSTHFKLCSLGRAGLAFMSCFWNISRDVYFNIFKLQ